MVPKTDKTADSGAAPLTTAYKQCTPTIQPRKESPPGKTPSSNGLPLITRSLQSKGISQATQETILNSWRIRTQKQYRVYLAKWQSLADKWAVDPLHAPVNKVLDFLQELYEGGLGYSCLNTARSALSSFIVLKGNITAGNHPLVQRFLKGVFPTRPAIPHYVSTWDTSLVLDYLKTLHPRKDIDLQNLTYKLVMLCALVTGQRCQTLHLMNLDYMHRDSSMSYIFHIDQLVKQSAPGKDQPVLNIPRFPSDSPLCVGSVLDEYINRTSSLRGKVQQLFISFAKPHHGVSKDTIYRWIKKVMQQAGIDTSVFKPHSTRAASTSKARSCNVSLTSVMKAASWRSDCVFSRFHNKPIQLHDVSDSFSHAILSDAM